MLLRRPSQPAADDVDEAFEAAQPASQPQDEEGGFQAVQDLQDDGQGSHGEASEPLPLWCNDEEDYEDTSSEVSIPHGFHRSFRNRRIHLQHVPCTVGSR